jgi:hypothetical protein
VVFWVDLINLHCKSKKLPSTLIIKKLALQKIPFGYIKDGKVYRDAFLDFPEREIGEVKESPESTVKYFEDRFGIAQKKVEELEKIIIESENKGSYLMKLIHLKKYLSEFDALGDFIPLYEKLEVLHQDLNELIAKNRQRNLEIKTALLQEAQEAVAIADWKEASDKVADIKSRWIKTGGVEKEHEDQVEGSFKELLEGFYEKRKSFFEDRNELIKERVERYEAILKKLEQLQGSDQPAQAAERVKELQKDWKDIGAIPKEKRTELWTEFKKYSDPLFEKFKEYKKHKKSGVKTGKPASMDEIWAQRNQLLEKAVALSQNPTKDSMVQVKKLQLAWKNAGKLPRSQSDKLYDQFFFACDMAIEKSFLDRLAHSKFAGFDSKPEKEQNKLKVKLILDLLSRDERELTAFQENFEKFSSGAKDVNKMMEAKLKAQQRKVNVKRQILAELKEGL